MTLGITGANRFRARYDEISPLRQALDIDPVLELVPPATADLLDVGCGTGDLLERAALQVEGLERVVGLDLSPERVARAREKLASLPVESEIRTVDLRDGIPEIGRFDCVVMMSVLHWLYPVESAVFRSIALQARRRGVFILSTYHPPLEESGLGGTDALVHAALLRSGWSPEAAAGLFADQHDLPISSRTRRQDEIGRLLSPYFHIDRVVDRAATMRADGAEQYLDYHTATFGDYYTKQLAEAELPAFLHALGEEAMDRMADRGHVTEMPIRIWRCINTLDKWIDVV